MKGCGVLRGFYGTRDGVWLSRKNASLMEAAVIFPILLAAILIPVRAAVFLPADNYLIDCGNAVNSSENGRNWMGDAGSGPASGYLTTTDRNVVANTTIQNDNLPGKVPFLTARIFTTPGSYVFPVTPGRHWLRLYFYPFQYMNFDPNNAVVTVTLDSYTLVASLKLMQEMQALNMAYIYKEFSINVTTDSCTVNIIPGNGKNSYAIVNGIELVSVPENLYQDSLVDITVGLNSIDFPLHKIALETVARLNVGGQPISANKDELAREWISDLPYIPGAAVGVANSVTDRILYGKLPTYTAPVSVYSSARSMTDSNAANLKFNLTWLFSVDSNFSYYIRLHFCELLYSKSNQRVFNIYINNKTAFDAYDVAGATGGEYIPTKLDFSATLLSADKDIRIQMTPNEASRPSYYDSILNGLEIFKMNDSSGNLQGSAHVPAVLPPGTGGDESKPAPSTSNNKGPIIGGTVGGVVAVALGVLGLCFVCRKKKVITHSPSWLPLPLHGGNSQSIASKVSTISHKSGTGSYVSSAPSNLCRYFNFAEITEMTNNFDEARVLGVGGFGKVYQGVLEDGTKVAVKRGNPCSDQGIAEFQTEIEMLSKLRHRHLVSLIGYCEEHHEMILVYDYMANGPLRGHLYGANFPPLSWKQRLEICIGSARGLHYLHTGAAHGIIHRDVKTTNILLDENFVAKVSDFGLSKTGPTLDHTHVSTAVKGSFGYLDPEYFRRQQLTEKSDVYSFGVVLMEVVCARSVINPTLPREQINLAEWALHWQRKGLLEQIIDPYLVGRISKESLRKFGEIAEKCLAEQGIYRPAMGDVLWNLEYALQLHETSAEKELDDSLLQVMQMPLHFSQSVGLDDSTTNKDFSTGMYSSGTPVSEDSDDATASAIFSQLVNPQGR